MDQTWIPWLVLTAVLAAGLAVQIQVEPWLGRCWQTDYDRFWWCIVHKRFKLGIEAARRGLAYE